MKIQLDRAVVTPLAAAALAFAATAALLPAKAEAATVAVTAATMNLRAGPSTGYPVVARLPARTSLTLYGCNASATWCDVAWDGERGWAAAHLVSVRYHGSYTVVTPAVAPVVGVAVIGFSHAYWNAHYVGRPWYGHWDRHHHHVRPHHPHRVKAAGGCANGRCGGVVAGPRRVAAGGCGPRGCAGAVIKRPHAGPHRGHGFRAAHGGFGRR
jgi:uncharacterized protein YraI